MSIRWIVFDAVGTLMYPTPKVGTAYFEVARRYGSKLSEREIAQRFGAAFASSEQADLGTTSSLLVEPTTSEESEAARWKQIVDEVVCDLDDTSDCFEELFEHFAEPTSWGVFDDVSETIDGLAKAGFQLAIASNFDKRLHSVCAAHPILRQIPLRFVSSEIGFRKPALPFYSAILDACKSAPGEMLMVGDGLDNDVQGALDAGWRAVHIDRSSDGTNRIPTTMTTETSAGPKSYGVVRSLTHIREFLS